MRVWRVVPLDASAAPAEPGGALWFPRGFQGSGRHDNPDRYACLYAAVEARSAVAEALAPFRGSGDLHAEMLVRGGRPLALAGLDLDERCELVDLDDPEVLAAEELRPSGVATRRRARTQAYAARLFGAHPAAAGLRWWSTLEASWINVTLFDRAGPRLRVDEVAELDPGQPAVAAAAEALGLA